MKIAAANFDRLARIYAPLERLAFGRALERARFRFLENLRGRKSILVLGEGDGRCLARLVPLVPEANIHCVDASAAMLASATKRVGNVSRRTRVCWTHADARSLTLPPAAYDAIVTLFFLDCFTPPEAGALVVRLSQAAQRDCVWIHADFALPADGWRRWRARLWLGVLYFFFRRATRITARNLPDVASLLVAQGWQQTAHDDWQAGLVRSDVWTRR